MKTAVKFVIVILVISSMNGTHCFADDVSDRDTSIGFENDTAPIINCATAQQDIAALEKQIADLKTKLLEEVEGIVPTNTPEEAGIIDPGKDIQAGEATEQDLEAKIANIKQVCALG